MKITVNISAKMFDDLCNGETKQLKAFMDKGGIKVVSVEGDDCILTGDQSEELASDAFEIETLIDAVYSKMRDLRELLECYAGIHYNDEESED